MPFRSEDVEQLMAMGFSKPKSEEALELCNGQLDMAINLMLSDNDGGMGSAVPTRAPPAEAPAASREHSAAAGGGLLQCGMSQYSVAQGRSACTCIALTAASEFLKHESVNAKFLEDMISSGVQNYQKLSADGGDVEHLSAEEVLQKDRGNLFPMRILPGGVRQGTLSNDMNHPIGLKALLEGLRFEEHNNWMTIVMTKTPETVLLCFPPDHVSPSSYWLIDSHPRPQLGVESAYAKHHPSLDLLLLSLQAIFPPTELGPDVPEMMAMMYNMFDLYAFTKM